MENNKMPDKIYAYTPENNYGTFGAYTPHKLPKEERDWIDKDPWFKHFHGKYQTEYIRADLVKSLK